MRTILTLGMALLAAGIIGCRKPVSETGFAIPTAFDNDTLRTLVAAGDSVFALTSKAAAVWPGFDLRNQVLIITSSRWTVLFGDPQPPNEYKRYRQSPAMPVFVREGTPPDSLAGLQLFKKWNGRPMTGLSYPSRSPFRELAVHEAFHTHQITEKGKWPGGLTPTFPDTSVAAVALVRLEAQHLIRALYASRDSAQATAVAALSVRAAKCRELGAEECDAEERVEQSEGVAVYVAQRSVGKSHEQLADSMRTALPNISAPGRLQRFHYYATGLSWILLLEKHGVKDWKQRIGTKPPAAILRDHLHATRTDR